MKSAVYIFVLVLATSCGSKAYLFTSFHEPADQGLRLLYSYDGKQWNDMDTVLLKPAVGSQKVMRDPSMVQDARGTFHLVWTSSWRGDKGFGYASSRDLLHWSEQKLIPVMQQESNTVNVWAPEIFYHGEKQEYIIIWASCIPGRFARGIEADSNNHRMYYTSTKNFENFAPAQLYYDPGFSVIDATILQKSSREYVLVYKDNTRPERNLKAAFSGSPLGPWTNSTPAFTEQFTEGPNVLKRKEGWYIYYDNYQRKIYETQFTKDFNHFINVSDKVRFPVNHKHGTVVTVKKKFVKQLVKKLKK